MDSDKSTNGNESFEISMRGGEDKAVAILPIADHPQAGSGRLKNASVQRVEVVDEKRRSAAAAKGPIGDFDSDFAEGEIDGNESMASVRLNSSMESEERNRDANLEGIYNRSFLIGSQSIREDLSTTNFLAGAEVMSERSNNESSANINDSTGSVGANFLKPLARADLNSSSQSSMDTRLKYGENADLVPLIELNSKPIFF